MFSGSTACIRADFKDAYYAGTYAACGKGAAENASRFFRRRFPKGTDFSKTPARRIRQVTEFINSAPKASLGGLPANEAAAAAA